MSNFLKALGFWIVFLTNGAISAALEFRLRAIESSSFPYFSSEIPHACELRLVDDCWYQTSFDDAMNFSHGALRGSTIVSGKGYEPLKKYDVKSLIESTLEYLMGSNPVALTISGYHSSEYFTRYALPVLKHLAAMEGSALRHVMLDGTVVCSDVVEQCVRDIIESCPTVQTLSVPLGPLFRVSGGRRESISSESCSSDGSAETVRHIVPGGDDAEKTPLSTPRRVAARKPSLQKALRENNRFCGAGGASFLTFKFSDVSDVGRKIDRMELGFVFPECVKKHAVFEEENAVKKFAALVPICAGAAKSFANTVAACLSGPAPTRFTVLLDAISSKLDVAAFVEGKAETFLRCAVVPHLGHSLVGKFLGLLERVIPDGLQGDLSLWTLEPS